jgi:hypothetical protein
MSAQLKTLLPQRRNTFVVIVILIVLGTALGLYYFYYVPLNQQQLHQYGFRMLSAISRNIAERNSDLVRLYTNNVSGEYRNTPVKDSGDIKAALDSLPDKVRPELVAANVPPGRQFSSGQVATATHVGNNVLEYEIRSGENTYARLQLPIRKLVENIISYRHELFESYLILKHDSARGSIVYQDDSLGLDDRITPDSILARRKGATFSQIADVSIQGVDYKLFCFPFTLDKEQDKEHLVLGGLIKVSDYRAQLGRIPVYLVYPLVILLLLIIISLPFLKIFLMGPYEQIRFSDLTGLGLAVFGGVTVITMIIIQLLLLARGYIEAAGELKMLSRQIEHSLKDEVWQIRQQLRFMDAALKKEVSSPGKAASGTYSKPFIPVHGKDRRCTIPLFPGAGKPYYNFDRANWIGDNGMQRWRLQVSGTSRSMLIDVKSRDYFKFFSQQYKDTASVQEDTAITLMAPVNSWSGGDFVINFAERSRIQSLLMLTVSTKMYSLLHTVLPLGYGFCIIDNKGKVYVHSEADRNLKENFLDEVDDADALIGAINSRQDTTLGGVHCYGNEHSVYLRPLSQHLVMHPVPRHSFFLVTFYNNKFISPVNLRILAFSLALTLVTFLLVMLWLLTNHGFSRRSLLYRDPLAARFTWIIPRAEDTRVYRNGCWFMAGYLVILLVFGVFQRVFSDYVTLALGLISPLNILIILYAYRLYCSFPGNTSRRWKTGLYFLLMLIYSMFIFWSLDLNSGPGGYVFWIFQGAMLLLLALLWLAPGKTTDSKREHTTVRLWHYSIFVLLLALCLGVLPMTVFTWYAHNREIEQSVKKQQLSMAVSLEKRRPVFLAILKSFSPVDSLVKNYFGERCWQQGIYGIRPCCVDPEAAWDSAPPQQLRATEHFYRLITSNIDMDYDEPSHYPVLHQASDNSWYWEPVGDSQRLHYMPAPGAFPDTVKAFRITMTLPSRYIFLDNGYHITMLALTVLLVLAGLYGLIRSTASRVFLLDFVHLFGTRSKDCPEDAAQTDDEIREMILQQRQKSAVFRSRWNRLSGRQRIILLDLVTDGLANYRNVMEISALTGEGQPLCICDGVIIVKDPVFRQFILEQRQTAETAVLRKEFRAQSLWESLRTPLLVVIVTVGVFIFLTQEDISERVVVLLTTLSSLLPLLPRLLGNLRAAVPPKDDG